MPTKKQRLKVFVTDTLNKSIEDLEQKLLVFNLIVSNADPVSPEEQKEFELDHELTRKMYESLTGFKRSINQHYV